MHYIVKIVFRVCREGEVYAEFDEQLRLIEATDTLDAYRLALVYGKEEEETVRSENGESIYWKLVDIKEMRPLEKMANGAFLWSNTRTTTSAEEYVTFVKARSAKYRVALQTATSAHGLT